MKLMSRAVKENPPRQPMLDLLRGTKGQPLHILCQLSEESSDTHEGEGDIASEQDSHHALLHSKNKLH
jgi:hypothetical protein